MTFPLKIEVTAVVSDKKEIKVLNKTDFPKGRRKESQIVEYLSMVFASPNFQWRIL